MRKGKKQINRRLHGFTLVELIVVLVILSVVSAIAVPSVLGYIDDGKAKECESRMKTLAADIATAKMSYEVDGTDDKKEFGITEVDAYIAAAGGDGKCGDKLYEAVVADGRIQLTCANHNRTCDIPTSGSFSVAVNENQDVREAPDPTATPEPEPTSVPEETPVPESTPMPETHTYTFQIVPDSSSSLENMEVGSSAGLTVQVYEDGKLIEDPGRITVEWHFPSCVSGTSNGMSATVEAVQAGGSGQITCDVTVADKDDETKKSPASGSSVDVSVRQPKPRLNGVPDNLKMDKDERKNDLGGAYVTDESEAPYPGNVKFKYESSDSSKLEVNSETGEVHALESGLHSVTVTATDESGNTITDENGNPVSKVVTVFVPTLFIELELAPTSLILKEKETGVLTATAVVKEQETLSERLDKPVTLSNWVSSDSNIVTVDGQSGSATATAEVTGKQSGNDATVTVTATAESVGSISKSAKVTVAEESGGLFNPNTLQIWVTDRASAELHKNETFMNYIAGLNLPKGTWEFVSGDGRAEIDNGDNLFLKLFMNNVSRGPFKFKYTTESGQVDYLTVLIGYPIKGLQMPIIDNLRKQPGEKEKCRTVLDPGWSSDVPISWELDPASTADVEWSYEDEEHININMTMQNEGAFRIRAFAYCEMTGKYVYSKWSPTVTVGNVDDSNIQWSPNEGQNLDITGVTLDPAQMTLEVGKSQTVTATILTKAGSVIDLDKVTYSFNQWGTPWDAINMTNTGQVNNKDNTATVTGNNAGNSTITVSVLYDGVEQENINAQCQVTVVEPQTETETETALPENVVEIDGKRFGAMSWAEFQANVRNAGGNSYKINQHRWEADEDPIVLYYDEEGIYIAEGNSSDFSIGGSNKTPSVDSAKSFHEFMGTNDGKEKFYKVDLDGMQTVKYDDLITAGNGKGCECGTIVKVERAPGEYEYYVVIDSSDKKSKLSDILNYKDKNKDTCGWWKLKILE